LSIDIRPLSPFFRPSTFALLLPLLLAPPAAQAQFPFEGIVNVERSLQVRSGPSENHYRTGILKRGERVTVVRQEADGWLAIDPPADSFSWVSGQFIREVSRSEGEVASDRVNVRVGTPINEELRDTVQVQLQRGDRVRILDRKTSGQGVLAKVWYKIAPPAGEMRYVKAEFIQPADGRRIVPQAGGPSSADKRQEPARAGAVSQQSKVGPKRQVEEGAGDEHEKPVNASAADLLGQANAAHEVEMGKRLAERDFSTARDLYEQAAQVAENDADQLHIARRLGQIEDHDARKAKLDEFDQIVQRSKERDRVLLSMARNKQKPAQPPGSRSDGGAKEQGAGIKDREQHPPPRRNDAGGSAQKAEGRDQDPSKAGPPKYDGSGVLRKSSVKIDGKPAYVLASPRGGVRYYVTPGPRVDLAPYEDQTVAVRGTTSFSPELQAQHIVVGEVTPIELRR
jgi:hypothetical protein